MAGNVFLDTGSPAPDWVVCGLCQKRFLPEHTEKAFLHFAHCLKKELARRKREKRN